MPKKARVSRPFSMSIAIATQRTNLEIDEVSIISGIVCFRCANGHPMVQFVAAALLLHAPIQVRHVEENGTPNPGKLVVIKKDDAALAQ